MAGTTLRVDIGSSSVAMVVVVGEAFRGVCSVKWAGCVLIFRGGETKQIDMNLRLWL